MTRSSILNIAATLVAVALSAPAMHAQTPTQMGTVKVPFAFESGSAHLPAGTYSISVMSQQLLRMNGTSQSAITMARWSPEGNTRTAPRVVFHHYGNQYFLREVWDGGRRHIENVETKAEATARKAPKELTVAGAAAPSVEVTIGVTAR